VPLELPNGMSPNGDGINDNLHVRGLEDFPVNKLLVYNRWGSLIYEENNYSNDSPWEGVNNGGEQIPEGTYFVIVELPDRDNLRGYLELRR
jgi:gliding motility-associated-like protein